MHALKAKNCLLYLQNWKKQQQQQNKKPFWRGVSSKSNGGTKMENQCQIRKLLK